MGGVCNFKDEKVEKAKETQREGEGVALKNMMVGGISIFGGIFF